MELARTIGPLDSNTARACGKVEFVARYGIAFHTITSCMQISCHLLNLCIFIWFVEVRKEAEDRLKNAWQNYCETGDELDANSPMNKRAARLSSVEDEAMLPLPDEVLTKNLGLDTVVVVTKVTTHFEHISCSISIARRLTLFSLFSFSILQTDYMTTLEKEYDYRDEYFDFMQQWIRRFCLQHGASLFYTSVKEDKNCDLLYKYLTHRIYDLPFRTPALVVEKDAVLM